MKGQIIGDSVFSVALTGHSCGVGMHGKAVIEERRRNGEFDDIGYYCEFHGAEQRDEARERRDRVR